MRDTVATVIHVARAIAAAVGLAVLAGCADQPPAPEPTAEATTATVDARQVECDKAANDVTAAVERLVASYASPGLTPTGPGRAAPTTVPTDGPTERSTDGAEGQPVGADDTADDLATTVEGAQRTVDRLGCSLTEFTENVSAGLAAISPSGPVATAVWRRVTASVLGEVEEEVTERTVDGEEDLFEAIAQAAPGSTLVLPAGTTELDGTIVLLDALHLRGQGQDATTLVSTTSDAAIIVATDGLVELTDLTLRLDGMEPVSGLVAGPSASVVLDGVRVSGATRGENDGAGGAGVLMSAEGDAGSGRGTTLEVTDSAFEDNDWAGLAIAGGHRVSIDGASVTDNGEVGILFMHSASGSVARSTLTGNTIGLAATGSSQPTWLSNTVSGGTIGVQLDGSVEIVMQGMRVTGPTSAAVLVGGEVTGAISQVTCENTPYGLVVGDGAAPTLTGNDCPLARGG